MNQSNTPDPKTTYAMGLTSSVAMGVGAMIGAGIFALLGQIASLAGGLTPWLFVAAAAVSMLSGYSYARLGVRYPSSGGIAEYLVQGYKPGFAAGAMTIMLYLSLVVGMGLVSRAFGAYAVSMLPKGAPPIMTYVFTSSVIVILAVVNAIGSDVVGRAERYIVITKVALLSAFIVGGIAMAHRTGGSAPSRSSAPSLVHAFALCLLAYQGFGVITNTVGDMPNAKRNLPRAIYLAVGVVAVVYVGIALATLSNLSIAQITRAQDYALAEAARPLLGQAGFTIVAITALLSSASCVNANLYSTANMTLLMATVRELPPVEARRVWRGGTVGLFSTAAMALVVANLLDLSQIATLTSIAVLFVFAIVHLGHFIRLTGETGASRVIVGLAFLANAAVLVVFGVEAVSKSRTLAVLLVGFVALACVSELIALRLSGPIKPTFDGKRTAVDGGEVE